ncbi:MAG TPA: class I adenylate-forming enzyme family protein [bacterium]
MSWFARFAAAAAEHAHRRAIVSPDVTFTYGDLLSRAEDWHRAHAGETGRVVAVTLDPVEALDSLLGAWRAGRPVAVLPPTLSADVLSTLRTRLAQPVPEAAAPDDRELYVLSTSGTTGLPKLVAQGERTAATILDYPLGWYEMPPGAPALLPASAAIAVTFYQLIVSLTHGWEVHVLRPGTPMLLLHEYILREQIRMVCGANAFYSVLLAYRPEAKFPAVAYLRMSGESVTAPFRERMLRAFPNATHFVTYGSTEAMRIASPQLSDPRIAQGWVGVPEPHYALSIHPLPGLPNGQGELHVRGPAMCLGYIGPSGAYEGLTADDSLPMRDVAELTPDGSLWIRGRVDALFKCAGQWVNPSEVERVLVSVPGVAEARCFPEPHPVLGSVPMAEVAPAPGASLAEPALRSACVAVLQRHQVPREFRIVEDVTRGASGKKLRS